jgi:hypothetical protein
VPTFTCLECGFRSTSAFAITTCPDCKGPVDKVAVCTCGTSSPMSGEGIVPEKDPNCPVCSKE